MHHKRRKRRRAGIKGCGMCDEHKHVGNRKMAGMQTQQEKKSRIAEKEQVEGK